MCFSTLYLWRSSPSITQERLLLVVHALAILFKSKCVRTHTHTHLWFSPSSPHPLLLCRTVVNHVDPDLIVVLIGAFNRVVTAADRELALELLGLFIALVKTSLAPVLVRVPPVSVRVVLLLSALVSRKALSPAAPAEQAAVALRVQAARKHPVGPGGARARPRVPHCRYVCPCLTFQSLRVILNHCCDSVLSCRQSRLARRHF